MEAELGPTSEYTLTGRSAREKDGALRLVFKWCLRIL